MRPRPRRRRASRSSSSASAPRCPAVRPPSPCAPAPPLLPAAVYFERRPATTASSAPPLDTERRGKLRDDVARVTQDLADELEELIRRAPEQWHLLQPNWPSDHAALAAAGFGRAAAGCGSEGRALGSAAVRIGLVCPYSLTVPGGVQAQVLGLARALRDKGHATRVLAPCDGPPPDAWVTPLG